MELAQFLLYMIEILGTVAFATSGAMIAVQRRMDMFGVMFLSVITSLGGGTLRDLLLGVTPPRMFYNYEYVFIAVTCALIVFIIANRFKSQYQKNAALVQSIINCFDAMGLGVFAVSGVQATLAAGYTNNAFLAIILGVTTAVGGGILRDIISRTVPVVLRKHVYALAAAAGASVYYLLTLTAMSTTAATLVCAAITFTIRMLATKFKWSLPKAL